MSPLVYLALGAIFVGVAVRFALASRTSKSSAVDRVRAVIDLGLDAGRRPLDTDVSVYLDNEPRQSPVSAVATRLGSVFSGRLTTVSEEAIREQLMSAGMYTISPRTIIGYRVLLTIALPLLVILGLGLHSLLDMLILALSAFAGWVLPLTYVQRKARLRIATLDRALPDLIDLMCVM